QAELLRIASVLRLGLHVDLVHAPEPVDVVDMRAAEERAERGVDVLQRSAHFQHLRPIDVRVDLRYARAIQRANATDFWSLTRGLHETPGLLGQKRGVPSH